jgi:hypothetical protein
MRQLVSMIEPCLSSLAYEPRTRYLVKTKPFEILTNSAHLIGRKTIETLDKSMNNDSGVRKNHDNAKIR